MFAIATRVALLMAATGPDPSPGRIGVEPAAVRLLGSRGEAQLLVAEFPAGGPATDRTEAAAYESLDPSVAEAGPGGVVRARGPGRTTIRVRDGGASAEVVVEVEDFEDRRPVDFAGEVVPILTRHGCNAGGCHGKASGQNGFRLSLLGFDPAFDFQALAFEGRGRRVFPAAPEASLLLRKASARVPHGGGRRLAVDSPEYETIRRWIAAGLPESAPDAPKLAGIEVRPPLAVVAQRGRQRLRVTARYADGTERDVTRLARFGTNAADLAAVDDLGRVETRDGVGEAAIMARFGGEVAVARVTVPRAGPPVEDGWPEPANFVDEKVFGRLRALNLGPSPACTDAEFARRSSVDICGILPAPGEVEAFEADADPDKRAKWVDRLLARPEYADLFALKWSAILRNKAQFGENSRAGTYAFHGWVRQAIAENMPYDRFVAAIVAAQGDPASNPPALWYREIAGEEKKQEKVDDTAQLFLGVRIQCARCHHHPFERWGQDDYYGFASFFERVELKASDDPLGPRVFVGRSGLATNPATGEAVPPTPPGGTPLPDLGPTDDPRRALADWLARPDNPYLARAVVNRYWKHFFGVGLVEPEDDFRATNPPSNPELLDALAEDFVRHGYDLRRLVRTLATSRAYDRSAEPTDANRRDLRSFARFYPRRLPAEILLDAVNAVTGGREKFNGLPEQTRAVELPDDGVGSYFLDVFGRPKRESVCECERSGEANLAQSLHLLNSGEIHSKLAGPEGRVAAWAVDERPDAETVAEIYRVCIARAPTADEAEVCLAHLARCRAEGEARRGFEDIVWTLINTKEFLFVN